MTTARRDLRPSGSDFTSPMSEPPVEDLAARRHPAPTPARRITMDNTRRVRHDVADGFLLMGFSLAMSIGIAGLLALLLGLA